jgi:hypothetical protein
MITSVATSQNGGKKINWLDYKNLDKWKTLNSSNKLNVALGLTQSYILKL